jgi:hypothetical protein
VVGEAASSGVKIGGSEGADDEVESPTHVWFLLTSFVLCCKIKELVETSTVWVSGDGKKNTEEGWILTGESTRALYDANSSSLRGVKIFLEVPSSGSSTTLILISLNSLSHAKSNASTNSEACF